MQNRKRHGHKNTRKSRDRRESPKGNHKYGRSFNRTANKAAGRRAAAQLDGPPEPESHPRLEIAQCGEKKRLSRRAAFLAAQDMTRRQGEDFNHYYCDFCGFWHVGHVDPAVAELERKGVR